MTISDIKQLVAPLQRRIMLMIGRAVVQSSKDGLVQVSGLEGEVRDQVELVQHYGFSSRPKKGADAVITAVGGNRDHCLVVATGDRRYVIPLEEGEAALWTDEGDYVKLARGKVVKIRAQTKLEIDSPEVTISGNLTVGGEVQGLDVKTVLGTRLNTHVHPTAAPGSPSPPTPGT